MPRHRQRGGSASLVPRGMWQQVADAVAVGMPTVTNA